MERVSVAGAEQQPHREWLTADLGNGLTAEGYSRGADKTFLFVPQLSLGLDAGLVCGRKPRTVFLSHTHTDHSADIAFLCKRRFGSVDVFCPKEAVSLVENAVRASVEMNLDGDAFDRSRMPFAVHGVGDGDRFELPHSSGQYVVEVFALQHSCPCVGFGVSRRKKKLAQHLRGMAGHEIAARRAAGETVDEEVIEPLFVFNGDTSIAGLVRNARIFEYPVVITECSFYPINMDSGEASKIEMKKDKHTAWEDLRAVVKAHPATAFILIHASLRHNTTEQILEFMATQKAEHPNAFPFINKRTNT